MSNDILQGAFRYENDDSPNYGCWIMHEYTLNPVTLFSVELERMVSQQGRKN